MGSGIKCKIINSFRIISNMADNIIYIQFQLVLQFKLKAMPKNIYSKRKQSQNNNVIGELYKQKLYKTIPKN